MQLKELGQSDSSDIAPRWGAAPINVSFYKYATPPGWMFFFTPSGHLGTVPAT